MPAIFGIAKAEIDRLRAFVRRKVASADDAEDIMQDVFVALTRRWNIGEKIEDSLAWLFSVAANKTVDWYRRKKSRPESIEALGDADAGFLWDIADSGADSPEESAQRRELLAIIEQAVSALPPEQKAVFVMHEIEGIPFADIARRSGVPLNTLLSRKRYAVSKLKDRLSRYFAGESED